MKKLIISIFLAITLIAIMAVPVIAAESSKQASVTVNEVLSFTVTDVGDNGIAFGTVDQGDDNIAADGQDADNGTVSLSISPETNVNCKVEIKGSADFTTGTVTMPLGQATWKDADGAPGTAMSTTPATVDTGVTGGYSQDIWHWISIPENQEAGTYTTNFVYSCNKLP